MPATGTAAPLVKLLGRFEICDAGRQVSLPASAQRVVAFLALRGRAHERSHVSSHLWMDKPEDRAHANLRSALWRIRHCGVELIMVTQTHVALSPAIEIDTDLLEATARALSDEAADVELGSIDTRDLTAELLPDWYDDFVELERERFRQMRLHALEALSHRLTRTGLHARALDAALLAVAGDPLRESAHRAVMHVHLAEGNVGEALRQFRHLARLLHQQLGITPSRRTTDLVEELDVWDPSIAAGRRHRIPATASLPRY
jgi:DNA-binding SARP family transcriptional activator